MALQGSCTHQWSWDSPPGAVLLRHLQPSSWKALATPRSQDWQVVAQRRAGEPAVNAATASRMHCCSNTSTPLLFAPVPGMHPEVPAATVESLYKQHQLHHLCAFVWQAPARDAQEAEAATPSLVRALLELLGRLRLLLRSYLVDLCLHQLVAQHLGEPPAGARREAPQPPAASFLWLMDCPVTEARKVVQVQRKAGQGS